MQTALTYFIRCVQHHPSPVILLISFAKLPEQLKSYYKTWSEHQNEHNSVEQNNSAYLELQKLLAAPVGMPEIAPAPRQTVAEQVDGHQASANEEPTDWQISVMLGRNSSRQTLLQLQYSDPALPGPHGQKRPAEEEAVAPVRVKQRAQRTCKKCHKSDCPGAFKSRPCKYKLDAPQRNIRSHTNAQQLLASEPQSGSTWVNTSVSSGQLQTQNVPHTVNMPPYYMYFPPRLAPLPVPSDSGAEGRE